MRQEFTKELIESGYIHAPLPLHRERAMETAALAKPGLAEKVIYRGEPAPYAYMATGGAWTDIEAEDALRLSVYQKRYCWDKGRKPQNYSNFAVAALSFVIPGEDWTEFNRLRFSVCPDTEGNRIASLCCLFRSEGEVKTPDKYFREGATVFDLDPHQWNECVWEFPTTARDKVEELRLYIFVSGRDYETSDEILSYRFKDIRIERVAEIAHEKGWERPDDKILYSTVGYWTKGVKTAVTSAQEGSFDLVDAASDTPVYTGTVQVLENANGRFGVLDFSAVTAPGSYYLRTSSDTTKTFELAEDIADESLWGLTNFFFIERCGYPIPGRHGACHKDTLVPHMGMMVAGGGGWHDAGDLNQAVIQSAEVVEAFLQASRTAKDDPILRRRLEEEGRWGLDFILRTRFGDGFRLEGSPTVRFTDNIIHTFDDVDGDVVNNAYHNFLYAQVEADAAVTFLTEEPGFAAICRNAAEDDFRLAMDKFLVEGNDCKKMDRNSHSKTSGDSLYYAVIVWAAATLVKAGADRATYEAIAVEYAAKLLACQEGSPVATYKGRPVRGFFYRDLTKSAIVHWNHQGREHQYMRALAAASEVFSENGDRAKWEEGMRLYGEYVKAVYDLTAPYGMIPAGIHRLDEPEDRETFRLMQTWADYEEEKDNYRAQLLAGTPLDPPTGIDAAALTEDKRYVLRAFPVWFSFRGNFAVAFGQADAAVTVGRYFDDEELLQIGREQFYWLWGKNPFGQSLIYGEGDNYCAQYACSVGESVGEVPVGMESYGNEDVPYWPQNNNCTYKEVWVSAACRVLQLLALLR